MSDTSPAARALVSGDDSSPGFIPRENSAHRLYMIGGGCLLIVALAVWVCVRRKKARAADGAEAEADKGGLGAPETKMAVWQGWLYYKMDTMLAMRINQFKVLVLAVVVFNLVVSVPYYFVGGTYGKEFYVYTGDSTWAQTVWDVWALIMDTGTQSYAMQPETRIIAAFTTIAGLMFAAVLTGGKMLALLASGGR